jgi:lipopolysaccharide export system protein LptA
LIMAENHVLSRMAGYSSDFFPVKRALCFGLMLAILTVCCGAAAAPLLAGSPLAVSEAGPKPAAPIQVNADRLELVYQQGWVDFIGQVKATQADVVMTADRMRVFYELSGEPDAQEGQIQKIVSEGNVKIVFDHGAKTAVADRAVYLADQQVLELSGGEAKVWSGKNVVRGKKITLFYAEKRSVVEGAGEDQVEATVFVKEGSGLMK